MKPYYKIHKIGGGPSAYKHATLDEAVQESERLAKKEPGDVFEILMCLGVTQCNKPSTFWNDGIRPNLFCAFDEQQQS